MKNIELSNIKSKNVWFKIVTLDEKQYLFSYDNFILIGFTEDSEAQSFGPLTVQMADIAVSGNKDQIEVAVCALQILLDQIEKGGNE